MALMVRRISDPEALRGLFRVRLYVAGSEPQSEQDDGSSLGQTLCKLAISSSFVACSCRQPTRGCRLCARRFATAPRGWRSAPRTYDSNSRSSRRRISTSKGYSMRARRPCCCSIAASVSDVSTHPRVTDVGRPLADLTLFRSYTTLVADAARVLTMSHACEAQLQGADGAKHHVRILPYRGRGSAMEGVVITCAQHAAHKIAPGALQSVI